MSLPPKVILGQSYYLLLDSKMWSLKQPYAPLGTLYAASFLRRHNYQPILFDAMLAKSENEWPQALDQKQPKYAVIYEDNFNYLSKMCLGRMREAAVKMLNETKKRGMIAIVCGSDATDHPEIYFNAGANFVIKGEGEITLTELLDTLEQRSLKLLETIPGLYCHRQNGAIALTSERPAIENLDELPRPAWDLVNIEQYRNIWHKNHGYFSMNAVTTRGCPYRCNWCAKPIWGQRYHAHSPERVAEDMAWIKTTYKPDHIWFADDILGLKPGWTERWAQCLSERDAQIDFKCLMRADLVNKSTAQALKKSHCQTVWMGAESGSQKILNAMDKNLNVPEIETAVSLLKKEGIKTGLFLQLGYSQESRDDIWKTINMVRRLMPDELGVSVSYPLPGTVFYDRVKDELKSKQNWDDSDDLAMLYQGPYPTATYRQLHRFIHRDLMMRRSWLRLTNPGQKMIAKSRHLAAVIHHALNWITKRAQVEWALNQWTSC